MHQKYLFIISIVFILLFATSVNGNQNNEKEYTIPPADHIQIISISDGSMITGRITDITEETLTFSTEFGILTIPLDRITSIRTINGNKILKGDYWLPDPNTTRLYFAPTGRMIPKGSGYFADYYLFFPSFNYGVIVPLTRYSYPNY